MSDFLEPNKSEVANQSAFGSFNEVLGTSFGKIQQGNQSFGPNNGGGSFVQNSNSFLVQPEQFRSSVGLEEGGVPIQIYEYQEPENQKGAFFRSSGDFELHFEEIRIDRLNLEQQVRWPNNIQQQLQDSGVRSSQRSSNEYEMKIESAEQISKQFKPEIKHMINQNIIQENKNLFNVNQAKSIYTNKISQLVEQAAQKIEIQTKSSPRLSKSQQKLQRKSPHLQKDNSDLSSNDFPLNSNDPNMDPVQQKLAKNRESARNSRARKKIYYELLETKVKELQDEVDRLKEQNKSQQRFSEVSNKTQEKFQLFLEQQQSLFDKLETCLLKNKDDQEINMILDALRYRTNSNSQERNEAARAYFDSMVEVCLPIQTKYLIYALEKNKDFFALQPDDYSDWMIEAFKKTDIKPEQIVKVKKVKVKLQSVRNNISDSIQKIKDQLKIIQSEAAKVDQMWEQLKECLTPTQLGTCILAMKQIGIANFFIVCVIKKLLDGITQTISQSEEEDIQQKVEQHSPSLNSRKLVKRSQG